MKYKALILDLDGTVSGYSSTEFPLPPSPKVSQALEKASKHIKIGLATSRPLQKLEPIFSSLHLNSYSILLNGSQIINSTKDTVWKKSINPQTASKIAQISLLNNVKTVFADFYKDNQLNYAEQVKAQEVAAFGLWSIPEESVEIVKNELNKLKDISIHEIHDPVKKRRELITSDLHATKQHAIVHIAKLLNVSSDQIIGVGDGHNDYPLLMACGLRVAMGNAGPELKAIADFVAPSVDEDGVATVIEKFILNQ